MADRVRLRRLALSIIEARPELIALRPADHVHCVPEIGGPHLVRNILQHAGDLAVANLIKDLAAELRVVALLVDRERAVADDRNTTIRGGDEVVPADVARAGHE